MDKLRTHRKKLIIALAALLVVMLSISIVYGKYTSSRVSVVDLTVKHTVTLTLNANLPADKTEAEVNIPSTPVVLSETGSPAKVIYPDLPMDKLLDSANGVELEGYVLDGWYLDSSCTDGKEVKAEQEITVFNADNKPATEVTLYAKWKKNEPQEIGGDIFYIDPDVEGAVYKFYDADKKEITEWDKGADPLVNLTSAKYYLKVGSNAKKTGETAKDYKTDKFYVVANEGDATTVLESGAWGDATADSVEDGIGKGKPSTRALMKSVQIENVPGGAISYPDETIWKALGDFIKGDIKNTDWYIGSKAEMDMYREWSGCNEFILSDNYLWTSTKLNNPTSKIIFWNITKETDEKWDETESSTDLYQAIPMRSF